MTDSELMSNYVLMGRKEYDAAIRVLQTFDVINDILDRAHESDQIRMIRIVLGKGQKDDK